MAPVACHVAVADDRKAIAGRMALVRDCSSRTGSSLVWIRRISGAAFTSEAIPFREFEFRDRDEARFLPLPWADRFTQFAGFSISPGHLVLLGAAQCHLICNKKQQLTRHVTSQSAQSRNQNLTV